jgi:hypothetical protein
LESKIFYVQPAVPNTLIARYIVGTRKNEVNTGTNHLGFRGVKDPGTKPREDRTKVQYRVQRKTPKVGIL